MKYTALASERQRQILWDPRQPVSQEPNNKVIHVVRRLLLNRVARAWHTHERRARDPGGEGPAHSKGDPAVLLPPQEDRPRPDLIQPSVEAVEVDLRQHTPQRASVPGRGDGGAETRIATLRA